MDRETKSVRERIHAFGNDLHGLTLQTELCKDHREMNAD